MQGVQVAVTLFACRDAPILSCQLCNEREHELGQRHVRAGTPSNDRRGVQRPILALYAKEYPLLSVVPFYNLPLSHLD